MKRAFLSIAANAAVLVVIRVVLAILDANSINQVDGLLAYSVVIGFSGLIVSLLVSKTIAKHSIDAVVIDRPQNGEEAWLLATVKTQAHQWNLKASEVAIYNSSEPNAFATGATKNSSLVAVSTGLLDHMTRDKVEAVLAHEMAYVDNGDMITLTLIQGIVNTFVIFLARIIFNMVTRNDNGNAPQSTYFMISMILQVVSGSPASIIAVRFSRQREYRADAGAAKLVDTLKMIATLQRLKGNPNDLPQTMTAVGTANDAKDFWFSTHPSLDSRISRLKNR